MQKLRAHHHSHAARGRTHVRICSLPPHLLAALAWLHRTLHLTNKTHRLDAHEAIPVLQPNKRRGRLVQKAASGCSNHSSGSTLSPGLQGMGILGGLDRVYGHKSRTGNAVARSGRETRAAKARQKTKRKTLAVTYHKTLRCEKNRGAEAREHDKRHRSVDAPVLRVRPPATARRPDLLRIRKLAAGAHGSWQMGDAKTGRCGSRRTQVAGNAMVRWLRKF